MLIDEYLLSAKINIFLKYKKMGNVLEIRPLAAL